MSDRLVLVRADRVHAFGPTPPGAPDTVAVRNGLVEAVGPWDRLRHGQPDAEIIDLRGTTITPGLTDAHIHILDWALARREADLSAAGSALEAARTAAGHAATGHAASADPTRWVRGRGWNPHLWDGLPDRGVLDRFVPHVPALLQSHDMHAAWVNSAALALAGIDAATPDPDGGRIVRDERGEPTGVLLENAIPLVERCLPPLSDRAAADAFLDAQGALHRFGITGFHSFPGVHALALDPLRVLETLRSRNLLRLRVLQHVPLPLLDDAARLGLRSGFGGDWIRIGAVKVFLDGALGSRTAWLRQPYRDTTDHGVQVLPEPDFRDAVRRAAAAGLAMAVHAIGDAAVVLALDVLAEPCTRVDAMPHRIEHVQLCPVERLGHAGRDGIVCSVQPTHLMTDWAAADRHWGERCRGAYAFRSLLRGGSPGPAGEPVADAVRPAGGRGAVLAFGSDAPVESVDPRLGLFAATERQDREGRPSTGWYPDERIGIREAFDGYTLGPAFAAGLPGRQGALVPGAMADLVAWDRDPLATSGPGLLSLRCVATLVGGAIVWREGT